MIPARPAYPESFRGTVVDVLHGVAIEDPYRWLEAQDSTETRLWIEEQAALTRRYFNRLPASSRIRNRVAELLSVETYDSPIEVAGSIFFSRRKAQQEQSCIVLRSRAGEDRVLVDPSGRGATTSVHIIDVSHDARLLAYGVKHGGEDTLSVEILDIETGTVLDDRLSRGALRGFCFTSDGRAIIYSHRPIEGDPTAPFCIKRHRLGTSFKDDTVLWQVPHRPEVSGVSVSAVGGRLLMFVVSFLKGNKRADDFYLYDLGRNDPPLSLLGGVGAKFKLILSDDRLFAMTNDEAPNFRLVEISLESRQSREVVPEGPLCMKNFAIVAGRIYALYSSNDRTPLEAYTLEGRRLESPSLPPGTISALRSYPGSTVGFLEFTSFTCPRAIHQISSDGIKEWASTDVPFDLADVKLRRAWFRSKDGTSVPMYVMGKHLDSGPQITILTAYGGFGASVTPQFTAYGTFLLEQGCTLAIANVRGGSEFGIAWHEAAKREKRQNAFDDFLAAAQWLIDSGCAAAGRIGIVGGSNAGLLIGAAITQRPDLFRAAICLGPVLDMLRYHRFGDAWFRADEFGCSDNAEQFTYLYAYSPYHRVRDAERYPAVLFVSGDQDQRCDPSHARKMTARLQHASASEYPVLIDYQTFRGHAAVMPLQVRIESLTDRLAFLCDQLGIQVHDRCELEL